MSDLTALTASRLEEIGPILADLVRARIVVEEERGGELSYELQHPLVRDVIYQATIGARRRVLHRQAARSLLRTGHLAEAALHFARSAERGDSEAVEVLLDAMRQAERREAYREALELQAELVDLLPADDQRWLEVLEAMYARAEWLIDHRAESDAPVAVRALSAIDGLLEGSSDDGRRAIVKFRLANFLAWGTGDLEPAYDACEQAQKLFARAGDRRQALLAARELGWIKGLRGDLAGMADDAGAVVRAADAADDRFVAMQELERLAVVSLGVRHGDGLLHANFVVAVLSDLFGIQARSGCFCAGPYLHRTYAIDERWSTRMEAEVTNGQLGAKLAFTRLTFNYFISEAVFAYIVDAVHLLAHVGWKLLPLYRFDPATGLWRHRDAPPDAPTTLLAQLEREPVPFATAPETVLAGQLVTAREVINAIDEHPPRGPLDDPVVSDEFERIRWFPLPGEALAQLSGATAGPRSARAPGRSRRPRKVSSHAALIGYELGGQRGT